MHDMGSCCSLEFKVCWCHRGLNWMRPHFRWWYCWQEGTVPVSPKVKDNNIFPTSPKNAALKENSGSSEPCRDGKDESNRSIQCLSISENSNTGRNKIPVRIKFDGKADAICNSLHSRQSKVMAFPSIWNAICELSSHWVHAVPPKSCARQLHWS